VEVPTSVGNILMSLWFKASVNIQINGSSLCSVLRISEEYGAITFFAIASHFVFPQHNF
jgi:hypothetical protein